ncbi:MAG: arylsulfatase [Bryobacteraceae bacterium]
MLSRRTFLAGAAAPAFAGAPRRPNIVVFLADDLGSADPGYAGSGISTPNIDRLAREGVRFRQFYSYPLCSPTRSALMTGRSPMRFGLAYSVVRPWSPYGLPVDEHIMPQTFRAAGYQTAAFGKWHLGHAHRSHHPNMRGFEHFYGHMNGAIDYFTHERDGGIDWQRNGRSVREEGYATDLIAAEAVRFIKGRDRSRPLFLYVPFNAPHAPLQAPKPLIAKYKERPVYSAMVDAMDAAIGRVLETLRGEGETLAVFLSDNGGVGQGRNHPLRAGKATTFEGGIRVPAILHWEGVLRPRVSEQVGTVMDIFPTLAAAAGIAPGGAKPLDGKSLWDAARDGTSFAREDLFFATDPGNRIYHALRRGDWKVVQQIDKSTLRTENLLFHLAEDPNEKNDLAAKQPGVLQDLLAAVEKWRALHPNCDVLTSGAAHPGFIPPKDWALASGV